MDILSQRTKIATQMIVNKTNRNFVEFLRFIVIAC